MSRGYYPRVRRLNAPIRLSGVCGWVYSIVTLLFMIVVLSIFLYVFPPWKIKAAVDAVWLAVTSAFHVASQVASSEQAAQKFLVKAAKSGREMWADMQTDVVSALDKVSGNPQPVISVVP